MLMGNFQHGAMWNHEQATQKNEIGGNVPSSGNQAAQNLKRQ